MANRLRAKAVIPVFYTKNILEVMVFTYFRAKLEDGKTTIHGAARDFQKSFGYDEDDFPLGTIIQTYYRMLELYSLNTPTLAEILKA
jgi:hypothetical protein